jgi:hypothetical protein
MFKCLRKNKNCRPSLCIKGRGKNFICSGINSKPSKYHKDYIMLCLSGELTNRSIEMTIQEAAFMVSALSMTLGELAPPILSKMKGKKHE